MGHVCPSFMKTSMIQLCLIWFVFAMHLMDRIDVIAKCMIFCEPMHLRKPLLYRDCASISSHVQNKTHGSSVHGIQNGFLGQGCNIVFDNRTSYSRASSSLLLLNSFA